MTEIEWMKEFGNNLRYILRDYNMTQKELADEIGLSETAVSYYIRGQRMPTIKTLINIGYALECEVEELITFDKKII